MKRFSEYIQENAQILKSFLNPFHPNEIGVIFDYIEENQIEDLEEFNSDLQQKINQALIPSLITTLNNPQERQKLWKISEYLFHDIIESGLYTAFCDGALSQYIRRMENYKNKAKSTNQEYHFLEFPQYIDYLKKILPRANILKL